jgi:hypothetical protein
VNERIRELADKVWAEEYWNNPNTDKLLPAQLNKFAKLIIRECADISKQSQWSEAKGEYYEGFNEAMIYVSNKIKQHFGVEE